MAALTLTLLKFKAAPSPTAAPLELRPPPTVTVLVGPNGSGKSRTLMEVESWCRGESNPTLVLDEVDVDWPTAENASQMIEPYVLDEPESSGNPIPVGQMRIASPQIGQPYQPADLPLNYFEQILDHPEADLERRAARTNLLRHFVVRLSGRRRFELATQMELGDLQRKPTNHLAVLFRDNELRAKVRELVHSAFNRFFVLDPTNPGQVRPRLSPTAPPSAQVERGLDELAVEFHGAATLLEAESDGIQSYVGLVAALHSLPHTVILVDEPEAFLHRALARQLGRAVGSLGAERNASIVASTHSADFVMGCLESEVGTAIVRLAYDPSTGAAGARKLDSGDVAPLMSDPYLRSTSALEGVFHRAVLIGEADADRAFYEEANRLLTEAGRGVQDALFLGMQGYGNIARVVLPLRRLGVPSAAIYDLDVLATELGGEWQNIYNVIGLEESNPERAAIEAGRIAVKADIDGVNKRHKREGVAVFADGIPARQRIDALIERPAKYGIFMVSVGEVERWLSHLDVPRDNKKRWIVEVLGKMAGEEPTEGDVWGFIDAIESWVADPARAGMPV